MRFVLFLGFISATTALFDATIWEAESWYKVYQMERLVWPDDPRQWTICRDCRFDNNPTEFQQEVADRGLPPFKTCNIAQFLQGIGTARSLGTFGVVGNGHVIKPEFKTMNYQMSDLLDEIRGRRANRGITGVYFTASKIISHPKFPPHIYDGGEMFHMEEMQEFISARAETCRLSAPKGPISDRVEALVLERVGALRVENMYRRSDQARYKAGWYADHLGYGPAPNKYQAITRENHITFPDGFVPQPDPNPQTEERNLETWMEIDQDATLNQGGQSSEARKKRKADQKIARAYGKPPHSSREAIDHMNIIETNDRMISYHLSTQGTYFCSKKSSKRRRAEPYPKQTY